MSAGPVALVGSGEFLAAMTAVDTGLLAGRPPLVAVLPTAAGREGEARVRWWLDLARDHYQAMGVEAVEVPVLERADAEDADLAARIEGVGLVYLSGGDPHHLAATLRGTAVWRSITAAWHGGAAVAGCSAGAMALTSGAPPDLGPGGRKRSPGGAGGDGLGLIGRLAVIPHFDVLQNREIGVVEWFTAWQPAGTTLVGVEEETALVGATGRWQVQGRGTVWVFGAGEPRRFEAGQNVALDPPGMSPGEAVLH